MEDDHEAGGEQLGFRKTFSSISLLLISYHTSLFVAELCTLYWIEHYLV